MKYFSKLLLPTLGLVALFSACNKVDDLPTYSNGTAPVLASSANVIAAPASDSLNTVVTFTWTDPKYASNAGTKYVVQLDVAGNNFASAVSKTLNDSLHASFTGKELNGILLGFGFNIGTAYDVEARVLSSYPNNNEQYASNKLTLKMTPYKIPPKIALPTTGKLFIVGNATAGGDATGWNNPVPTPTQEFARLDETTFAGVFYLNGGKEFLVLPENGSWDHKFALQDNTLPGLNTGGDFGFKDGSNFDQNFKGPAADGMYRIVLDFQRGKFTIAPYGGTLPTDLFIIGSATPGGDATGWNNPVPGDQQLTRLNSSEWEISVTLHGGKQYLLLPVNGDWGHKYAVADNSISGLDKGGEFGYDFGSNFPGPANDGTYKISVNFARETTGANTSGVFKVTQ